MASRWRKVGIAAIFVVSAMSVAGWIVINPRTTDSYKFLDGRRPAFVGVTGPGSWSAKECRSYTWKMPWKRVAAEVRKELGTAGMTEQKRHPKAPDGASWLAEIIDGGPCGIGSSLEIDVMKGQANRLTEFGYFTDGDPEWVTVFVTSDLDNTWANVLRYTFFPIPEK
ncbi:MAG: hypothetical protein H7Y17_16805 [Chlorobia bacterium]|nr:hypothetical protein [Fimbriimonadaceae bacterium]